MQANPELYTGDTLNSVTLREGVKLLTGGRGFGV